MEIQEIKERLSLAEVLGHYGLKPDKNLRLRCPFHNDKTPSLQVYYKTDTAYCFSPNCKTHGKSLDVIDFVMHKENCTKAEAIKKAEAMVNGQLPMIDDGNKTPTVGHSPLIVPRTRILESMFAYFKNAVHNSRPAQEYLKGRGLDATRIEVGYNTAQFHHGARKDETLINNCVAVGLLSPWGTNTKTGEQAYKPFAKYCLCFALRDRGNHITGLYFRSTVNGGSQKHYYLKESTGLYPKYPEQETEKLIITESVIDAASLLQLEDINKEYTLLAAYGTNRLNGEMKAAIGELEHLREIIFAFDSDEAGGTATAKYAKELKELLPHVAFSKMELPCKDVNETLQAHQPEIFSHLLENRTFLPRNNRDVPFSSESGELPQEIIKPVEKKETLSSSNPENLNQDRLNTSNPNKIIYATETATYYILGGLPGQLDHLKVMLGVENKEGFKSRNRVDLYEDRQTEKLCREVSEKLRIRKDLMEKDVYRLTELAEAHRESGQGESKAGQEPQPAQHFFTLKERTELENFLKKPGVIRRLNETLGKTGIVGEERNRIFLMLVAVSYKMKDPLHSLVQGSSGSGKTRMVRQVSDCIPQESVTRFTRISDKALYNYPQNYFTNRLLIVEDVDGLSEEAEMAFRELQSSGELRSSVSIKLENGSITGGEKVVCGPIASMSCTTKGEVYEDNMSRVFLIAVDESLEQTKRIIAYQNAKASGKIDSREEQKAKTFIQDLIRIIEAKEVVNPYAEKIQLPEEAHKIRRLNDLFQNFIKMVALVNQYRRKTQQGKLIAEIEDVETAVGIMFESIVLKVDELDGSLRQFFERLKSYLKQHYKDNYGKVEFTQREVRQGLHISKAQINRYLQGLTELEYLRQNGFANKGFRYRITYWDNYEALRKRIKENLFNQIAELKTGAASEPPKSHLNN